MFKGCEFESRHCILDGHIFTYLFVGQFVMCVRIDGFKLKRWRRWPIFKKTSHKKSTTYTIFSFTGPIPAFFLFFLFFANNNAILQLRSVQSYPSRLK